MGNEVVYLVKMNSFALWKWARLSCGNDVSEGFTLLSCIEQHKREGRVALERK